MIVTPTAPSPRSTFGLDRPGVLQHADNAQFIGLAYDSLVNFQQSPGADGLRLVPDLALSIPTPGDGGTIYMFRIRRGIRYSDGQPLLAGDFLRGFERMFRVGSPGASLFEDIIGAGACSSAQRTATFHEASSPMTLQAPSRSL